MKKLSTIVFTLALMLTTTAAHAFTVNNIEVNGNNKVSDASVQSYLPVRIGSKVTPAESTRVVRALYKTGLFKDVKVSSRGNTLVVDVTENPTIVGVEINGNERISDEKVQPVVDKEGLVPGFVLKTAALARFTHGLRQAYVEMGNHSVVITPELEDVGNNRVVVKVNVQEGVTAKLTEINIVGNKAMDEDDILDVMELGIPSSFNFFSSADEFSQSKLQRDLTAIKNLYMNHGFLRFQVLSSPVNISEDKKDVVLTINVEEGEQYKVSDVQVIADKSPIAQAELEQMLEIQAGELFSREKIVGSADKMQASIRDKGFAFAKVNTVPKIDENTGTVSVKYYIDTGKPVYVRRIAFTGNHSTNEEVLRREMRQLEGEPYSGEKMKNSKERLQRLGYIAGVKVATKPVKGTIDQVDVDVAVEEMNSRQFNVGMSYGQTQGIGFNVGLTMDNFLGTGQKFKSNLLYSRYRQNVSFSFTDPYFTEDGISQTLSLYYRRTNAEEVDVTQYTLNEWGLSASYGIPVSEHNRIHFGLGVNQKEVIGPSGEDALDVAEEIKPYADETYDSFVFTAGWTHDSRDRYYFANEGFKHTLSFEVTTPGSDLEYWKASYRPSVYIPLGLDKFVLNMSADISYGESYGDLPPGAPGGDKDGTLPFFENYFAGGVRTVRGYRGYSLGPVDSNGDEIGGSYLTVARMNLIFPWLFDTDNDKVRLSAFYDIGNVFDSRDNFDSDELRESYGLALTWLSPVGPLTLSYAEPIDEREGDDIQNFQFALGVTLF